MGLRLGTLEDLDIVLKHAKNFKDSINFTQFFNEEKLEGIVRDMLTGDNNDKVIILHDDVGMLAGVKQPFPFGDVYMAFELAWWVDPEYRMKSIGKELLEAFEHWGKLVGCSVVTMSSLDTSVHKFYEKCGYAPYEYTFFKEIV